jgi:hypothetical protein
MAQINMSGVHLRQSRYIASMDVLIRCLNEARRQLADLERKPDRTSSYFAKRKRAVIAKLESAIRAKLAWHLAELRKAEERGFAAGPDHEPKSRSFLPKGSHSDVRQ